MTKRERRFVSSRREIEKSQQLTNQLLAMLDQLDNHLHELQTEVAHRELPEDKL